MMSLMTIRDSSRTRFLEIRNFYRIIVSDDFAIAYDISTDCEKNELLGLIENLDKRSLRTFIKKQLLTLTPFHSMGVRRLREIAKNVGIPMYWNKNKATLIEEIEDVIERIKDDC